MLVYVAVGAETAAPLEGFKLFSRTSLDRLLDACARLGGLLPLLLLAGVVVPLVESPSSAGVASPLMSWGVARADASLRDASPTIALRFLFLRWFGRQFGLRKFL